jgi:hypothetical protein
MAYAISTLQSAQHQLELAEFLKLHTGWERLEAWADVPSPPALLMHPVADAAAMTMGLPVPTPGSPGEDPELAAVLDVGSSYNRDLEDLRGEFRPRVLVRGSKGGARLQRIQKGVWYF